MTLSQQTQDISEQTVGKISMAIGGTGITVQMATDYVSMVVLGINLLLAAAGAYLMFHKLFDRRRNRRKTD